MDRLLSSFISSFVVVRGICLRTAVLGVGSTEDGVFLFRIATENTAQGIKGIAFGDDDIFVSWVE